MVSKLKEGQQVMVALPSPCGEKYLILGDVQLIKLMGEGIWAIGVKNQNSPLGVNIGTVVAEKNIFPDRIALERFCEKNPFVLEKDIAIAAFNAVNGVPNTEERVAPCGCCAPPPIEDSKQEEASDNSGQVIADLTAKLRDSQDKLLMFSQALKNAVALAYAQSESGRNGDLAHRYHVMASEIADSINDEAHFLKVVRGAFAMVDCDPVDVSMEELLNRAILAQNG